MNISQQENLDAMNITYDNAITQEPLSKSIIYTYNDSSVAFDK